MLTGGSAVALSLFSLFLPFPFLSFPLPSFPSLFFSFLSFLFFFSFFSPFFLSIAICMNACRLLVLRPASFLSYLFQSISRMYIYTIGSRA